jgi:hypothetical protein
VSKARTAGIWSDWEIISPNRVQEFEKAQLAGQEHLEDLLQDIHSFELLQDFFASAASENAGVIHVISQS